MQMLVYIYAFLMATMVVRSQRPTNERYIILLKEGSDAGDIEELIQSMEVHASSTREEMYVGSLTSLLPFVYGNISEATAEMVSKLPNVDDIIPDQAVDPYVSFERDNSLLLDSPYIYRYHLDIINDVDCANDNRYNPNNLGSGADIYILDSGINFDHTDFRFKNGTSGTRAKLGFDAIDAHYHTNEQGRDPIGTGTHYAGIAGGVDSGFASDANLYSVRVKGPAPNYGNWVTVLSGMEAVFEMHNKKELRPGFVASIASITISGESWLAYRATIALNALGIVTVFPSGDSPVDCNEKTLCRAGILCVGAHEYEQCSCKKKIWPNSGYGTYVNTIAPGVNILSASNTNNNGFSFMSGTSTASSLVSGVVACMKAKNPYIPLDDIVTRFDSNNVDDIDKSEMASCVKKDEVGKRLHVSAKLFE